MASTIVGLARRALGQQRGSALVETALVAPLLLMMAFAIGRVLQARMGVAEVAQEAATTAALANNGSEAAQRGLSRGKDVAAGYGLTNGSFELTVDPGAFDRGGQVIAVARYRVSLGDLPLLQWTTIPMQSRRSAPIDLYRSRWPSASP